MIGPGNTGGTTPLYGPSAPAVGSVFYRVNTDGSLYPVTCTGYTESGWPIRTLQNTVTGAIQTSRQLGRNTFLVTSNGQTKIVYADAPVAAFD